MSPEKWSGKWFLSKSINYNQNRRNSQRSPSDYCNLTISKEYIDRLLLTINLDQDMTITTIS